MMRSLNEMIKKYYKEFPVEELEILLAEIIKKDKAFVIAHPEYKLSLWQAVKLYRFLRLRKKGYSVAAIIGHKEFYGLDFFVNRHVLIPRPETELLVDETLNGLQTTDCGLRTTADCNPLSVVLIDVGTGSGCIPIAIKRKLGNWDIKIFATDISRKALRIARKNAKKHGVKIKFLRGDLLQLAVKFLNFSEHSERNFSISNIIITANLPYLTEQQFNSEPSIQKEPRRALIADNENGLSLYEKLLIQVTQIINATMYQCNNVTMIFEIDPSQTEAITKLISRHFPQSKIEIKKDLAGLDRLVHLRPNLS